MNKLQNKLFKFIACDRLNVILVCRNGVCDWSNVGMVCSNSACDRLNVFTLCLVSSLSINWATFYSHNRAHLKKIALLLLWANKYVLLAHWRLSCLFFIGKKMQSLRSCHIFIFSMNNWDCEFMDLFWKSESILFHSWGVYSFPRHLVCSGESHCKNNRFCFWWLQQDFRYRTYGTSSACSHFHWFA